MKNYRLHKLLVAKTGLIFGVNKFGHYWVELRFNGQLKHTVSLLKPYHQRLLEKYYVTGEF